MFGRHATPAVLAKNVLGVSALAAHVHSHVFHQAQNRHAHFFEHADAFAGIDQGDVLRCGDDDRASQRHALRQRQGNVARAWRHVDDQIIQITPKGLAQQLLQGLRDHGTAPNHGVLGVDQKPNRHHLHAVVDHGLHGLAVQAFWVSAQAHHHGLTRAINIRVQQTHLRTFGGQGQSQVGRRGALAHTAFARGHGHDVLHAGQELHATLHRMRLHQQLERNVHCSHAGNTLHGRLHQSAQRWPLALGGVR